MRSGTSARDHPLNLFFYCDHYNKASAWSPICCETQESRDIMWYYEWRLWFSYIRHLRTICRNTQRKSPRSSTYMGSQISQYSSKINLCNGKQSIVFAETTHGQMHTWIDNHNHASVQLSKIKMEPEEDRSPIQYTRTEHKRTHKEINTAGENIRYEKPQEVITEKLPVSRQKWGCFYKLDHEQHLL